MALKARGASPVASSSPSMASLYPRSCAPRVKTLLQQKLVPKGAAACRLYKVNAEAWSERGQAESAHHRR